MSRTNDVNIAMQYAKSGVDGVHLMDSHKATIGWVVNTLAAEVERLEAGLVKANEAARAAMYAIDERAFLAECAEKSEKRAEAAEARVAMADQSIDELQAALNTQQARVAELEAEALNGRHAVFTDLKAQLAAANEQNARLRGTLMRVTGSLGLVLKGAGIAAPAHKENYDAAKKLIEETFSGDREEAST